MMIPSLEKKYHENKQLSSPCEKNVLPLLHVLFNAYTFWQRSPSTYPFLDKPILKHFFNNSATDRQTARGEFARPISKESKYISPKVYRVYIYIFLAFLISGAQFCFVGFLCFGIKGCSLWNEKSVLSSFNYQW